MILNMLKTVDNSMQTSQDFNPRKSWHLINYTQFPLRKVSESHVHRWLSSQTRDQSKEEVKKKAQPFKKVSPNPVTPTTKEEFR